MINQEEREIDIGYRQNNFKSLDNEDFTINSFSPEINREQQHTYLGRDMIEQEFNPSYHDNQMLQQQSLTQLENIELT